jgi:hypothetical protein
MCRRLPQRDNTIAKLIEAVSPAAVARMDKLLTKQHTELDLRDRRPGLGRRFLVRVVCGSTKLHVLERRW